MIDNHVKLLTLCRTISGISVKKKDASQSEPVDSRGLFDLLQYHQVAPLAYYYREQLTDAGVHFDPQTLADLKSYTLLNISRVMVYEHYLKHLNDLMQTHSVDYRLFKGIVTAKSVYAADYLRSFGDVDILICPTNLKKVEALLEEDGFTPADDLYRIFPDEIIQKYSFAQHFIRSEPSNVAVDLHLNMSGCLHPFQFDFADFWDNSSSFSLDGHEFQTFDPEHQAVYAIYHAFKHYFFKLIWFIDAFLLLDRHGLDQAKFQALIKKYKLSKLLDYYASITRELFGRLPAVINDYRLDSRGEHRLINSRTILSGFLPYSPSRARLLLPMYYMKGPFSRFGFLWRQLFPPMETIRDFYVGNHSGKGVLSYIKLRCKAITDLCLNKTKEEYSS